jgi:hypothetical protein
LRRREIVRLTVVWSMLAVALAVLLAMLWPAEKEDQGTQGRQGAVAQNDRAAHSWSLFAFGQDQSEVDAAKDVLPVASVGDPSGARASGERTEGLPSWTWGVDVQNSAELYERWVGFAATQGTDHFAVDSLVGVLRRLGWRAAERMVEVAITRGDWRVTSAVFASGFVGIENVERQEMVRRLVHSRGCANHPECAFMDAVNEVAPDMLKAAYAKVAIDRDTCGLPANVEGMKLAVLSIRSGSGRPKGLEWCSEATGPG